MASEEEPSMPVESVGGAVAVLAAPLDVGDHDGDGDQDAIDVGREQSTQGPRPLVFISYRHGSDQPTVSALKVLLERAITPSPEVFIASEGGIRPSPLGYKPQLQSAVQRAAAFIGVITQSSKDREWLFFEAGAAWGLGKLYAPFLVETDANELSTTIADLQATNAHDVNQVRRMIDAIASEIGSQLRDRFGQRYSSFARHLQADPPVRHMSENGAAAPSERIADILALLSCDKTTEANKLISKLEEEERDIVERLRIRILIVMRTKKSSHERLEALEQFPSEYAAMPSYLYYRGIWEASNDVACDCLREVIAHDSSGDNLRRAATISLADRLYKIRRTQEATEILLKSLRSQDRELRRDAAALWCRHRKSDSPLFRFMLAGFGHRASQSSDLLTQQAQISIDEGWVALAVHAAESADALAKSGRTANDVGRAYMKASLPSLAYEAYLRGAANGASVARCNIATMVSNYIVPAVGIQILDQHQGRFDAATPEFPYKVRADLERMLHVETQKRDRLQDSGELLEMMLVDLVESALRKQSVMLREKYFMHGECYRSAQSGEELVLMREERDGSTINGNPLVAAMLGQQVKVVLHRMCESLSLWRGTIKEREHLLMLDEQGSLVGVSLDGLSDEAPDPAYARFDSANSVPVKSDDDVGANRQPPDISVAR